MVGTSHHYQFGAGASFEAKYCTAADEENFALMIGKIIRSVRPQCLAEELSIAAVNEAGKEVSVLKRIASECGVLHLYCDPDRIERAMLNIYEENHLLLAKFPEEADPDWVEAELRQCVLRREREWLRRIIDSSRDSTLFVCGSSHVTSFFLHLAGDAGLEVVCHFENWEAGTTGMNI